MWTIAAANKKIDGPLGTYNGLTDVHLAHYFSRPSQQSHLKAAKLISNDGTIIPEQKVKVASLEYERQKQIYEMLANTVIQNAAHKQGSWNKKVHNSIEDVSRIEKIDRIRVGSKKKMDGSSQCRLVKSATTYPLQHFSFCGWFKEKYKEYVATFPRSAPSTSKSHFRSHSSTIHQNVSHLKRCISAKEISPYIVPGLLSESYQNTTHKNTSLTRKRRKKNCNSVLPKSTQGTFNKLTKVSLPDQTFKVDNCKITLLYHGPFNCTTKYPKEEILIRQQHCGGTPVVVYKGQVASNETVTFICLNHHGYTFSITVFVDGIRYLKLSSCCIFRYPLKRRLGGSCGKFSIQNIEGGKPCIKCQCHQIELCSKELTQKLICVEKNELRTEEKDVMRANDLVERVEGSVMKENEFKPVKNSSKTEEMEGESEYSKNEMDDQNSETDDEIIEDEINLLDSITQSDKEELKSETVSSHDSDSSVNSVSEFIIQPIAESELQIKPYENTSSSDDEDGKQHVILASVHGSPHVNN